MCGRAGLKFLLNVVEPPIDKSVSFGHLALTEEKKFISPLSLLLQYGAAMGHHLPLRDFRWLTQEELDNFSIEQIDPHGKQGYILEVDLHYPNHLHIPHSSFPLAAEQIEITQEMLSPYASDCLRTLTSSSKHKAKKLSATFNDRKNYTCHGLNLKLYLEQGLQLVKIHKAITFEQAPFLKDYISMCTKKRASAPTKSYSNMMKLLCNSLYGKMIEDVTKRSRCKFIFSDEDAKNSHSNPLFKGFTQISENFSMSFIKKRSVKMNQAWAVGFSILELSKYIMQHIFYNLVKPTFPAGVSVLMTDTDSFVLLIKEKEESALKKLAAIMDFSNYPPSHPLYDCSKKNQVGFLKNELPHGHLVVFIGLRAKAYTMEIKVVNQKKREERNEQKTRLKGVKKAVRDRIQTRKWLRSITEMSTHNISQFSIQAKAHVNRLIKTRKVAFSSFDDKRYLLCAIHSVPYGSILIAHQQLTNQCYFCKNKTVLV